MQISSAWLRLCLAILCCPTGAVSLAAQCALAFQPTELAGTPRGVTRAMQQWDPDGPGPAPALLVVGGNVAVGSASGLSVVSWDGAEWHPVGAPPVGICTALSVFGGELVAAVSRSSLASDIFTFDGTSWRVLGSMNGVVDATTLYNGNLVLGGPFSWIDGVLASGVVQWNGSAWSAIGAGAGGVGGTVRALAVFSGSLYVGGDITHASGVPVSNLAIWNGTGWAAGPSFNGTVHALVARITTTGPGSALFVGGAFTSVGVIPAQGVARYDAVNSWATMGAGLLHGCSTLFVRGVGLTGFELSAVSLVTGPMYRWSSGTWNPVGTNINPAQAVTLFRGSYVAVVETQGVRVLDADGSWLPLSGIGIDGPIATIHATPSDVVISGSFVFISRVRMNGIARGRIGAWQPLGSGLQNGSVWAIASLRNGDIIAAGTFTSIGGVSANRVARWNGSTWSPLGTGLGQGLSGSVSALAVLANDHVVAAGDFLQAGGQSVNNVALWNGSSWMPMGAGFDETLTSLAILPDGEVVAGGVRSIARNVPMLGRWNGSTWLPFPSPPDGAIFELAALPNGDLLVAGSSQHAGGILSPHIARWNGSGWIAVPGFTFGFLAGVHLVVPLPDGDAIVDGATAQPPAGPRFSRFDGQAVVPLPAPGASFSDGVLDAAGDVLLVGDFVRAGGVASAYIARMASPCPAAAPSYGSGCAGSGGMNSLRATRLPWVDTTFRAEMTGMSANTLALAVFGLSPTSIPLASLLRQGLPGCHLLASLDLLDVVPLRLGIAYSQLAIPAQASLIGQVLHHQVVAFELDGSGHVLAVTSSNGLRLTIGAF